MLLIFVIVLIIVFGICCANLINKEDFQGPGTCDPNGDHEILNPVIAGNSIKECVENCAAHKDIKGGNCDLTSLNLASLDREIKGFDSKKDINGKVILDTEYKKNTENIIHNCLTANNKSNSCKFKTGNYNPCLEKCINCRHPIKCNWRYELESGDSSNITGGKLAKKKQCDASTTNQDLQNIELYGVIVEDNPNPKIRLLWTVPKETWGSNTNKCGTVFNKTFTALVFRKIDIDDMKDVREPDKLENIFIKTVPLTMDDVEMIDENKNPVQFTYLLNMSDKLEGNNQQTEDDGVYIISIQFNDENNHRTSSNSIEIRLSQNRHIYGEDVFKKNTRHDKTNLLNTILGKTFEITL